MKKNILPSAAELKAAVEEFEKEKLIQNLKNYFASKKTAK